MKKVIILFIIFIVAFKSYGQDNRIIIKIINARVVNNNIEIEIEISNPSNKKVAVYIPGINDICSSLLFITFLDLKNRTVHQVYPCNYNANLKYLKVNKKNGRYIYPKCKIYKKYIFSNKSISPYLIKKEIYSVKILWYIEGEHIITNFENMVNYNVESDSIIYIAK